YPPVGGAEKPDSRGAQALRKRSAASSAPAPPESGDKTMMSAGATGSLTTSAHPAARRAGSRTEGTTTMVVAANATTTRIRARLGPPGLMLWFPLFALLRSVRQSSCTFTYHRFRSRLAHIREPARPRQETSVAKPRYIFLRTAAARSRNA